MVVDPIERYTPNRNLIHTVSESSSPSDDAMSAFRPPLDMRRRSSGHGLPTTTSLHPANPDQRGGPPGSLTTNGNGAAGITNSGVGSSGGNSVDHVKSPGELTVFVDKLLIDLEAKFEHMSAEVLDKMNQMSNRIDNIEHSIAEIISFNLDGEPLLSSSSTAGQPSSAGAGGLSYRHRHLIPLESNSEGDLSPSRSRSRGMDAGVARAPSLLLTSPSLGDMTGSSGSGAGMEKGDDTAGDSTIKG